MTNSTSKSHAPIHPPSPARGVESACADMPTLSPTQWESLRDLAGRPALYQPGEASFWTDPHIASMMLALHLDPDQEAASRSAARISQEVEGLFASGAVRPGDRLLDLGCGPGLYAVELARRGVSVTGLDSSRSSLEVARKRAEQHHVTLDLWCMDFFDLDEADAFDAIIQVYGEMNVFSPEQRNRLLSLLHRALKSDGRLTFDVTTRLGRPLFGQKNSWSFQETGFWAEGPHLLLADGFDYPEHRAWVDQYVVMEPNRTRVFRNWFRDYEPMEVTRFAEENGFSVVALTGGLDMGPLTEMSQWIGVQLRKR